MVMTIVISGEALDSTLQVWGLGLTPFFFPPKLIPEWPPSSFLPWELCALALCLPVFPREKDAKYSRKDLDTLQERTSWGGRGQGVFPSVMRIPEQEGVLAITYLVQSFSTHRHLTEERAYIWTRETQVS